MRYLYSGLLYLAIPFILLRTLWRSRRQPDYRKRLAERFGFYSFQLNQCIWVHAVSVGEVMAAIPLIKALKEHYPHFSLLVTTMTPTGSARVQAAFNDQVKHAYIPYDLPGAMKRFIQTMHPHCCLIMETELWPNLIAACQQTQVPIFLMNARLSAKSAHGYRTIGGLTRHLLQALTAIAAQSESDAERFIHLGASPNQVTVTGNLKFDIELPNDLFSKAQVLHEMLGKDRFIWIAASTHEGEEEIIFAAHQQLIEKNPSALLILVPRHPDRFDTVARLAAQSFQLARRRSQTLCTAEKQVYLGDTMGELLLLYAVADVAFVGGSLLPFGGHNLVEPAALAKPILSGPYLFNFAEISELLKQANAIHLVSDAATLSAQLLDWVKDPAERRRRGDMALQVVSQNRGALSRQLEVVKF